MKRVRVGLFAVLAAVLVSGVLVPEAKAHCDTLDGPVVTDARKALASGSVTSVLKWVSADYEDEITASFKKTLKVRKLGDDARELADTYFFETLVRVHREREGAPYTGLKDEAVAPIVQLADAALETGSVDAMSAKIAAHVTEGIKERFDTAVATKKKADATVEEGREFVEAYVVFVHYVEGIKNAVVGAGHHGKAEAAPVEEKHEH